MTDKVYDILCVDDDEELRQMVASILEAMGHKVRSFEDGLKGQASAKELLPDLAVLDLMTPGLTGAQLCQWLKSQPEGEYVPVLIVTAIDETANKVELLEAGADDYLTKPFKGRELQARVRALLRMRDLYLRLKNKNRALAETQQQLVTRERQLAAVQLAGTAAHTLGQPLTAMKLNCHLLETLKADDPRYSKALQSIKMDLTRMAEIIDRLRRVDASKTEDYHRDTKVMKISELDE